MNRAKQIEERHDFVDRLARLAAGAMPPGKADEFAVYLGHNGIDRRYMNRVAPAVLPEITIDRPRRKARAKLPRFERSRAEPKQGRLPLD